MSVSDAAKPILDGVYKLQNDAGHDASYAFQILPDRKLVDYYRVIKRPMALNMIRNNLKAKKYSKISQFVYDLVQITHNARTYNPPESFIYTDALVIDRYLRDQLTRLRQRSIFDPADLEYPDLGPLPVHESSSGTINGQANNHNGSTNGARGDYEDSMDSMDDSDLSDEGDGLSRRRRRPVRQSVILGRRKREAEEEEEERQPNNANDKGKKRGRPPTVDKPHEHRIKAVLRAVRRERDPATGRMLHAEFDKLPDAKLLPDYYEQIREPIALDSVRKSIKRRQYASLDAFLDDMNRMFENAKTYNHPDSVIYQDAVTMQQVLTATAREEMEKPDSVYQDPDSNSKTSRLALDQVEHRGETLRVGDWVHISNPNDPAKPTIGQIFRIWEGDGERWINACWYYRPEQTVHRYDKVFYENEVVKSGQYRDHTVDEVLEKCFVMFITKYQRGRPAGIGNAMVYCCESRYNEQEKSFNKIRTWKACIPDEIRSTDYPMDLFDKPRPLRRLASPIKNLLPPDAKDTDPIPEPKMGAPNAPPIVGAVYKRPYDPNDPPVEPDPPSPPPEAATGPSGATLSPAPNASGSSLQLHARAHSVAGSGGPGGPPLGPTLVAGGIYSHSGVVYSGIPNGPGGAPIAMPTAYVLPSQVVAPLRADELEQIARLPDGQPLWFQSCPVWVPHRILSDPIPRKTAFSLEGDQPQGLVALKGIGHSAKYMAWKLKKQNHRH